MTGFRHILFPVDFSERCLAARPFVKSLAQKFNARITLLHALGVPRSFYGGVDASYPIAIDWDAMKDDALNKLQQFLELDESFQPEVSAIAVVGEAAIEIVDYTVANKVDLIMMPTHGYGPFRAMLLGSITAKVLHDCDCPVWTAAHTDTPSLAQHCNIENVMCAIDTAPDAVRLIHRAVEFADSTHATLRLIHAAPPIDQSPMTRFEDVFRADIMRNAREAVMRLQEQAGTHLDVCMEMGTVSKVVHAASLHHEADLVITGHGRIHGTFGRLRTNEYAIIRDAPCPVMSL